VGGLFKAPLGYIKKIALHSTPPPLPFLSSQMMNLMHELRGFLLLEDFCLMSYSFFARKQASLKKLNEQAKDFRLSFFAKRTLSAHFKPFFMIFSSLKNITIYKILFKKIYFYLTNI
jgi:hypothetical protein